MFSFIALFLTTAFAFPIPQHLNARLPTLPRTPRLAIKQTSSHVHATLTHPSLNDTPTARVTLSSNPLTVRIQPIAQRPLTRRIPLRNTFTHVSIRARSGAIELLLRKTVEDLPREIAECANQNRKWCLTQLAGRVCQTYHVAFALSRLACDDHCVEMVLEECQKSGVFTHVAEMVTQVIFGAVVGVMLITYGWGFLCAIMSIPGEFAGLLCWLQRLVQQICVDGMKFGITHRLMTFV